MATAKKTPEYWRHFHNLPDDYIVDGVIFYGTWPHPNRVVPDHEAPLRAVLEFE